MIRQGISSGGGGGGGIDGPTFRAYLSSNAGAITSGPTTIVFDTVDFDSDGAYDAATGIYDVATAGVFLVTAKVADYGGAGAQADASITVNSVLVARGTLPTTTGIEDTYVVTTHLNLAVGDAVLIEIQVFGGTVTPRGDSGGVRSYFSMARVGSTP